MKEPTQKVSFTRIIQIAFLMALPLAIVFAVVLGIFATVFRKDLLNNGRVVTSGIETAILHEGGTLDDLLQNTSSDEELKECLDAFLIINVDTGLHVYENSDLLNISIKDYLHTLIELRPDLYLAEDGNDIYLVRAVARSNQTVHLLNKITLPVERLSLGKYSCSIKSQNFHTPDTFRLHSYEMLIPFERLKGKVLIKGPVPTGYSQMILRGIPFILILFLFSEVLFFLICRIYFYQDVEKIINSIYQILKRSLPGVEAEMKNKDIIFPLENFIKELEDKNNELLRTTETLRNMYSAVQFFASVYSWEDLEKSLVYIFRLMEVYQGWVRVGDRTVSFNCEQDAGLDKYKMSLIQEELKQSNFILKEFSEETTIYFNLLIENDKSESIMGLTFLNREKKLDKFQIELLLSLSQVISSTVSKLVYFSAKQTEEKRNQLIHQITFNFSRSHNMMDMIKMLIEKVQNNMQFQKLEVFLYARSIGKLIPYEYIDCPDNELSQMNLSMPDDLYDVFKKKEPMIIPLIPDNVFVNDEQIMYSVEWPIFFKGESYGVLKGVIQPDSILLQDESHKFFSVLMEEFAVFLKNFFLLREISRRVQELETIHHMTQSFTASLEINHIILSVFKNLRDSIKYDLIGFVDFERKNVSNLLLVPDENFKNLERSSEDYIQWEEYIERTIRQNKVLYFPDMSQEKVISYDGKHFLSVVTVPLIQEDKMIGILLIASENMHCFSYDSLDLLKMICNQLGIALRNALLVNRLKTTQTKLLHQEKMHALGTMASGVAHDINNLLAGLMGHLELAQEEKSLEQIKQRIQFAYSIGKDGANLVKRLQDFSRVSKGIDSDRININSIIKDAVETLKFRWFSGAMKNKLNYKMDMKLGEMSNTYGNVSELRAVFINIINNALDAMPHGGVIHIETFEQDEKIYIQLRDTGIGISPANLKMIFEPFFTTKGDKGTGLGLAEVHNIISRHKGEIRVYSEEHFGTEFMITLPLYKKDPEVQLIQKQAVPSVEGLKILIAEDEDPIRLLIKEILEGNGHQPIAFNNALDAYNYFIENKVDFVLSDIGMPEMDGWELAKKIRAVSKSCPIIFTTGWGMELESEKLTEYEIDEVITKPFKINDLIDGIARIFMSKKMDEDIDKEQQKPASE